MTDLSDLKNELNPEQYEAVMTINGAILIIAGAGSGKTRVITFRIAHMLDAGVPQSAILALTFTNKAAKEMSERIKELTGKKLPLLTVSTFHAFGVRILRQEIGLLGYRENFSIYDETDRNALIKETGRELRYSPEALDVYQVGILISDIKTGRKHWTIENEMYKELYEGYQEGLKLYNAVDFDDLITLPIKIFREFPEVLAKYKDRYKYIMVDEFQDTSHQQYEFMRLLAENNVAVVGDDDQSIYSWRGAEIKNILDFEKTFPGTVVIRLETNYRSTGNILGAANSLIRHNDDRLGKDLRTSVSGDMGEKIYVFTLPTDLDEAKFITDAIAKNGPIYNDKTILIRSGSLSRLFEEEFARRGIPYRLIGATKFYDRMEIRDAIAYIRLLVHPFDDMSFMRAIGKPRRGFGPSAIEKMRAAGENLMAGLRAAPFRGKQLDAANEFLSAFDFDWENMPPRDAAQKLLDASGYIKMWQESKDVDAPDRINNVRELINTVIAKYDSLQDFLEQAALMMTDDNDEPDALNQNAVNIMTIHAAKGLEFNNVFLPAAEEGIFPNDKSIQEGAIAEERRLAYVAITRARKLVIITNAMSRVMYGERKYNAPSRFIGEIDSSFLSFGDSAPRPAPKTYEKREFKRRTVVVPRKTLVGRQARHSEYGTGVIIEEGTGILTIAFGARGIKKIARDFVTVL